MTIEEIERRIKDVSLDHLSEMLSMLYMKDQILVGNFDFIIHAYRDIEFLLSRIHSLEEGIRKHREWYNRNPNAQMTGLDEELYKLLDKSSGM